MSSISPTSRAVYPSRPASTIARLCSSGRRDERGTEAGRVVGELRQVGGFSFGRFPVEPDQDRRVEADRPAHSDCVDREIAGDREQPTHHAPASRVVRRRVTPGTEKRLLCDVFGRALVGDDGAGQTEDATLEAPDERRRRIRIAGSEPRYQRVV